MLPLYPQLLLNGGYGLGRTGRILARNAVFPGISFIRDYADDGAYIDALAKRVSRSPDTARPDVLPPSITAFHNVMRMKAMTTRSAVAIYARTGFRIGTAAWKVMMTFQSLFVREPWLTPYTDETLKCWVKRGLRNYIRVMSGVCHDCLERWKEWRNKNREIFP